MTDEVQALENAEERIEEFRAATLQLNLTVKPDTHMARTLHRGTCPACGERLVGVVAWNGVVKGYCTNTRKFVRVLV
jgi:hypothetical protein